MPEHKTPAEHQGTTDYGTPAEQRNTPEKWWNNGTTRNTSGTPQNNNGIST